MHPNRRDRIARTETRAPVPPPVPREEVPVTVPVVRCPQCGAARMNQWQVLSGGRGDPYRRCRSCGSTFVWLENGTMRLVR